MFIFCDFFVFFTVAPLFGSILFNYLSVEMFDFLLMQQVAVNDSFLEFSSNKLKREVPFSLSHMHEVAMTYPISSMGTYFVHHNCKALELPTILPTRRIL